MTELETRNDLIESKIDRQIAAGLPMTELGVAFRHMGEVMEFAKMMAVAGAAVPMVFRGNPGACLAVAIKAQHFGMEPFSFASKCYFVNDNLAYEGQLIHAIIIKRAGLLRRPVMTFTGEGDTLVCTVTLHLPEPDGEKVYVSPPKKQISPQNSPLWKSDPVQQLAYYSVRAAARRFIPDVIMGMYDIDEMAEVAARDVNPRSTRPAFNGSSPKIEATYVESGGKGEPGSSGAEAAKNDPPAADQAGEDNPKPETAGAETGKDAPEGDGKSKPTFEQAMIEDLRQMLAGASTQLELSAVAEEFKAAIDLTKGTAVAATMSAMIIEREKELSP